jgi:hypothetical protein
MPSDVWHQLSWNKQRSVVTQNTSVWTIHEITIIGLGYNRLC